MIVGVFILFLTMSNTVVCDADSDCFYIPEGIVENDGYYPALIVLSCTGATAHDLDSIRYIADSFHIILASCHKSRNHRDGLSNDRDIMKTYEKLVRNCPVDLSMIFMYGFSGMGVQSLGTLFWHPQNFRGVIAVCAHQGAMQFAHWNELGDKYIYLISREKDWNLEQNRQMHDHFTHNIVQDTLAVTPGEHAPATQQELLDAIHWLLEKQND